jgi:hypothetical protein
MSNKDPLRTLNKEMWLTPGQAHTMLDRLGEGFPDVKDWHDRVQGTVSLNRTPPFTMEDLQKAIELVAKVSPPIETIEAYMRKEGCPPEQWGIVLHPELNVGGHVWPKWVHFSPLVAVDEAWLVKRDLVLEGQLEEKGKIDGQ